MSHTENEARESQLSFPPAEPPPFPDASASTNFGRRKLAALAGIVPLGAVAVYLARHTGDGHSEAQTSTTTTTSAPHTLTTRTAPPADVAPEIARIGGRHIAALHAIHLHMSHMATYDPQSLDDYFAGAIDAAAGAYRQQLIDTNAATRAYITAINSHSQVLEFNCGLRAITGGTALGIGYIKQSMTSDLSPDPVVSLIASAVTAEEQPDGRWLVTDFKRITT
ncbi:hypothetical protein D7D52_20830 [Nocardia yunnanensis]|uniref:Mce-associated membrane protein n=1 Tax=Nocardia yunnanensis TaxID=2382165 RepID=A0A386ZEQ0_9NOCA|nr:hypothetical protein [Nocardia yunnanensis]AYF75877.1 hypothetical protein D7D52_20830 [Nocardia yunnanensis]